MDWLWFTVSTSKNGMVIYYCYYYLFYGFCLWKATAFFRTTVCTGWYIWSLCRHKKHRCGDKTTHLVFGRQLDHPPPLTTPEFINGQFPCAEPQDAPMRRRNHAQFDKTGMHCRSLLFSGAVFGIIICL